jgi:uncharacterized protein
MRIGIIGAGVSGMTAAWLLQDDHHVTLLDRAPRFGGHVESVPVTFGDKTIYGEYGPRFFFDSAYPHFLALLELLGVPVEWSDAKVSFTTVSTGHTVVLPPRSIRQAASLVRSPRLFRHILSLRRLTEQQPAIARRRDFTVTFGDHLEREGYPKAFGPEFAYPFLAACWGAPLTELPGFPVYSLLKGMPPGKKPGFREILEGVSSYAKTFGKALTKVEVRLGVGVSRIERSDGFVLTDDTGARQRFDRLIVATSARDAATLLSGVPSVRVMQKLVGSFRHFDTDIVVHGDPSFMPRDPRDWSHSNLFIDGDRAWMSDWQGARDGEPLFRTWLPKGHALPQPLYGRRAFHHLIMTPENAVLQRRIASLQGRMGLWVTGMYAADVDNHESALLSALVPAMTLAPRSANLARLLARVPRDAAHGLEVLPAPLVAEMLSPPSTFEDEAPASVGGGP